MNVHGPLVHGDRLIGDRCPACHVPFVHRDWVAQIPVGPGGDPAARTAARSGAEFRPVTIAVHWPCHTGHENPPGGSRLNHSSDREWAQW